MIDVKQAVQIAKQRAAEILEKQVVSLEEIEREAYKDRDVWSITLSFPRDAGSVSVFAHLADPLQYKRVLVDAESGELVAIKVREVAIR